MRFERHSPPDRRNDDGLVYDAANGVLELGVFSTSLPPAHSNAEVLRAYIELAGRCRNERLSALVDVRQSDAYALCVALDLDAGDLAAEIEFILGASREQAYRLIERLKQNRVIGGVAAAATTTAVAATLVVGSATGAGAVPQAPVHLRPRVQAHATALTTPIAIPTTTVAPRTVAPTGAPTVPVVVDENGVGLIAPMEQDANGVGLIPPAQQDAVKVLPPVVVDNPNPGA